MQRNFPSRPTHPDFWRLSHIIIDQDRRARDASQNPGGFRSMITEVIDPQSLTYMASQRALRILGPESAPALRAKMIAAWMDAFMAGAAYSRADDNHAHPADTLG